MENIYISGSGPRFEQLIQEAPSRFSVMSDLDENKLKLPEGFPMKLMITMGISDNESKEQSLREMGLTQESIDYNLARNL